MVQYFKENYPNKYDTKDTAEGYKELLLAKLNIHDRKFMTMLKKAISFEPITDIEKFITENVCDIEDDIDITAMQENIIYYKQQEDMAQSFEKRLDKLEGICRDYSELEKKRALRKIQQFLIDYGTYMDYTDKLEKAESDLISYNDFINEYNQKLCDVKNHIEALKAEHGRLSTEKEKYLSDNNWEWLHSEQKSLKSEIEKHERDLERFILSMKAHSVKWIQNLEKCASAAVSDDILSDLQAVISCLKRTEKFEDNDFEKLSVDYFNKIRELYLTLRNALDPVFTALKAELENLKVQSDELNKQINELKKGIKQYPPKAERLKKYIHDGLSEKYNRDVPVSFLADLIEVTDEEWHNAVEGYLNTQRMNIIVPPEYFMDAYYIYKNARKAENIHEYAIVDLQRVYESSRASKENSLAKKVKSNDKYVQAYTDYLLGNVVCCYDESRLRDFKTSVTRDSMLYHNFAVKPLNSNAYDNPYIGRNSIEKQIRAKERTLNEINVAISEKKSERGKIEPVFLEEWFLTESYISSAVPAAFSDYADKNKSILKLKEVEDKLSKINLFWVTEMDEKIKAKDSEIKAEEENCKKIDRDIWEYESKRDNTKSNIIPELKDNVQKSKIDIDDRYSEDYCKQTGIVRYEKELSECKAHIRVAEKFASPIKQTATKIKDLEDQLMEKRSDYNKDERTSFKVADVSNNDEYEKSYLEIKDYELPKYREQIKSAKDEAMEQFKSDFLFKLRCNILSAEEKINELNRALKLAQFGNDTYSFKIEPNPALREYYDMIMSDELDNGNTGLFSIAFTDKYQTVIDSLFSQITSIGNDSGTAGKNVEMFSKYKTYLKFSLISTDANGKREDLSRTIFTKSGGESQTPFYIAVLASFAELYRVNDSSDHGNTARIVIFDEAFNKMDGERIVQSVHLLRKFGLQAIVCSPPEKVADIAPVSDKTLLVQKIAVGKIYKSTVIEWTKEMSDLL